MRGVAGWLVIAALPMCLQAQIDNQPSSSLARTLPKNLWQDQKTIWTRPLHVTRGQAGRVVLFSVVTAALIATDKRTSNALPNTVSQIGFSENFSNAGLGLFGGAGVGMLLFGKFGHRDHLEETGLLAIEAMADTFAVTEVIKEIAQRERPSVDGGRGHFWAGGSSFPSGHTMISWSAAEVIASEFHQQPLVRVGAYTLAGLVSLSRFPARKHFLSDVFAGAAGGLLIGRFVYSAHHVPDRRWSLIPIASLRTDPVSRTFAVSLEWSSARRAAE